MAAGLQDQWRLHGDIRSAFKPCLPLPSSVASGLDAIEQALDAHSTQTPGTASLRNRSGEASALGG
ncbi:MAG: hypothetical protein CRU78_01115 [Candidatus Accumulibacter phosphatis]|uniref:Uncharacterized protein n=1 Tax=Candidatus Accumulibacter phosphatis TaxID=327160 RepID=A0A6A7RPS1_9PROT|nr:hypothetical protein [Candidatus Accumulibacter phosphatis]